MKIIDLDEHHQPTFFACLEDWSEEMKESGNHKEIWYSKMIENGIRVKLAVDENDVAVGMIQYIPIEHSFVEGEDLYFIFCIWVHGYKKGIGNFQKKGIGKDLLQAAEEDVREKGAKGIVAWGISFPFWMKASWFKKHGYKKVDKQDMAVLMWKSFTKDAIPPKWVKQKKSPQKIAGKVTVTSFKNGWCPAQNLTFERAKRAVAEFGSKVEFKEIDTFQNKTFEEWGITDALYIDEKLVRTGPPPSYKKIKKKIANRVKKLK